MKLVSHKAWKEAKLNLLKKVLSGLEGPKNPENEPKMRFLCFWQKSNPFTCTFLLEYEWTNGLLTFCKSHIWEKSGSYGPKTSRPIRMQYSLIYNISQTSYGIKFNFCKWSDIYRSNKFTQSFLTMPKIMPNKYLVSFISRRSWAAKLVCFACC